MLIIVLMVVLVLLGITKVIHSLRQLKIRLSILEKLVKSMIYGKEGQTKETEKAERRRGNTD